MLENTSGHIETMVYFSLKLKNHISNDYTPDCKLFLTSDLQ